MRLAVPFHRAQRWRRTKGALEQTLCNRPHAYFSTACRHEMHDRCRLVCKWCSAECMCRCHKAED